MHILPVFSVLGAFMTCMGLSLVFPLGVAAWYGEYALVWHFTAVMAFTCLTGAAVFFLLRPKKDFSMGSREGVAVVGLAWLMSGIVGALPYMAGAALSFPDAFFEAVSGFTTTGASILTDIESMPKGLLFWRSQTQWMGGVGIIVFSIALLPFLGAGGMQLYKAEVSGPIKDKFAPRMKDIARSLWLVYLVFTFILILLLLYGGMGLFDAVNHAFTTMATGGFSTKNSSIAAFNSPFIEWVITLFMFLAGINFGLYFLLLRGEKAIFRSTEARAYTLLTLIGGFAIALSLTASGTEFSKALRDAFFQVVSIGTTTGFASADYLLWPLLSQCILLFFMLLGACAGSTAGGFKVMRVVILFRMTLIELKRLVHPNMVDRVRMDTNTVRPEVVNGVVAFAVLFIAFLFFGGLFSMAFGHDFVTSFSAAATALSNVGPGFGAVGPTFNFAFFEDPVKIVLSMLMLLGRLEIFTILLLFMPMFWKK